MPSSAARHGQRDGGRVRRATPPPQPPYDRKAGSRPKLTAHGQPRQRAQLDPGVVEPGRERPRRGARRRPRCRWRSTAGPAGRWRTATVNVTVLGWTQPWATGLSCRSAAMSRWRSATSLSQPAVTRPTSTVTNDQADLARRSGPRARPPPRHPAPPATREQRGAPARTRRPPCRGSSGRSSRSIDRRHAAAPTRTCGDAGVRTAHQRGLPVKPP